MTEESPFIYIAETPEACPSKKIEETPEECPSKKIAETPEECRGSAKKIWRQGSSNSIESTTMETTLSMDKI